MVSRRPTPKGVTKVVALAGTPGAQSADYVTSGTISGGVGDEVAINAALTSVATLGTNGRLVIREGNYNLNGPIVLPDTSAIEMVGMGINITYLNFNNLVSTSLIQKTAPTTDRYKLRLADFTIDNQAKTNANSIGLDLPYLLDCRFERLLITNVATAVKVWGRSYECRFIHIDVEECTNGFLFTRDPGDTTQTPNENALFQCKFTKALSGTGVDYPINVQYGNDNHFTTNSIEDFLTGIEVNSIGNSFTNNRIECNDRTGTVIHVQLDSSAANCQFMGNYYSGNKWVSWSSSIVDNGAGNAFIENNTFKDQKVVMHRNALTADEYVHFYRDGSGDAKGLVTAEDTYSPSGSPIQFLAKGVRSGGKFFSGQLSGTEKAYIDGSGNISGNDVIIATPSTSTTGHAVTVDGTQTLTKKTLSAPVFLGRTTVADAGHTVSTSDFVVALTSVTASRTFTMTAPSGSNTGQYVIIKDESGALSSSITLTVTVSGGTTIDGAASIVLNTPYAQLTLYCNGTNWETIGYPYDTIWRPRDNGLISWNYDPVAIVNNYAPTAGTIFGSRITIPQNMSITNILCVITASGSSLSNCFVALYDSTNTLIAQSADQSSSFTSTGVKTIALSGGPFTVNAGKLYVIAWVNGTVPSFGRGAGNNGPNANLSSSASRFFTADTGKTTTAPSALGTLTSLAASPWFALN